MCWCAARSRQQMSFLIFEDRIQKPRGLDVLDLSLSKQIRRGVGFNYAIDNLNNKRYYETQNYFESRVTPTDEAKFRVHGAPGYPIAFTVGRSFRL